LSVEEEDKKGQAKGVMVKFSDSEIQDIENDFNKMVKAGILQEQSTISEY
jgi:hypothetical protein